MLKEFGAFKNGTVASVSYSWNNDHETCIVNGTATGNVSYNFLWSYMDGLPEEIFVHADELRDMGLALPEITEIFSALAARGVTFEKPVYTRDYAVRKLLESYRKEEGNL